MANNHQELVDVGGDDIFVCTGGQAPRNVRRAKIDESMETIPTYAFYNCEQLVEVKGHNKLKKIERSAFNNCTSLRWMSNMNGIIEIEWNAFSGCSALRDVEF